MDYIAMMENPKITVLMPVFNAENFLNKAIESILTQTFKDFEFLIINDGSTDNSEQIINNYAKKDSRIRLINRENHGLVDTLNFGIKQAKAELIARFDADDICMLSRLKEQFDFMQMDKTLALVGSFIQIISVNDENIRIGRYPITYKNISKFISAGSPFAHPAVMFLKSAILSVGGYRKAFIHCEDYDLWLRLFEKKYNMANIPKVLIKYRQNPNGISQIHSKQQALSSFIAQATFKMRKQGLKDPIIDTQAVNENTIKLLPKKFIIDYENQKAEQEFTNISNLSKPEIKCLIKKIEKNTKLSRKNFTILYLKAAHGMLKNKLVNQFLLYSFMAFLKNPHEFIKQLRIYYRSFLPILGIEK